MKLIKTLLAGAAVATIVIAFRDPETGGWLLAGHPGEGADESDEEPVLGYDGMDRDTLIDWLRDANLDALTLRRVRRYEAGHADRAAVRDAIDDLMAG